MDSWFVWKISKHHILLTHSKDFKLQFLQKIMKNPSMRLGKWVQSVGKWSGERMELKLQSQNASNQKEELGLNDGIYLHCFHNVELFLYLLISQTESSLSSLSASACISLLRSFQHWINKSNLLCCLLSLCIIIIIIIIIMVICGNKSDLPFYLLPINIKLVCCCITLVSSLKGSLQKLLSGFFLLRGYPPLPP